MQDPSFDSGSHEAERGGQAEGVLSKIDRLRRQGIYSLAGILALLTFAGGYLALRPDQAMQYLAATQPQFEITQNDKKEWIKLDRVNGDYWVIEDGVEVRAMKQRLSIDLVEDKSFSLVTADGTKLAIRAKYLSGKAYCTVRMELSDSVKRSLSEANARREFIETIFYSNEGVSILRATSMWNMAKWVQEGNKQMLEINSSVNCPASVFETIGQCRVYY